MSDKNRNKTELLKKIKKLEYQLNKRDRMIDQDIEIIYNLKQEIKELKNLIGRKSISQNSNRNHTA